METEKIEKTPRAERESIFSLFGAVDSEYRFNILEVSFQKGPLRYSDLGYECGFEMRKTGGRSPESILAYHLKKLKDAGLIEKVEYNKYGLTEDGKIVYIAFKSLLGLRKGLGKNDDYRRRLSQIGKIEKITPHLKASLRELNEAVNMIDEASPNLVGKYKLPEAQPVLLKDRLPEHAFPISVMKFGKKHSLDEIRSLVEQEHDKLIDPYILESYLKGHIKSGYIKLIEDGEAQKWELTKKFDIKSFLDKASRQSKYSGMELSMDEAVLLSYVNNINGDRRIDDHDVMKNLNWTQEKYRSAMDGLVGKNIIRKNVVLGSENQEEFYEVRPNRKTINKLLSSLSIE